MNLKAAPGSSPEPDAAQRVLGRCRLRTSPTWRDSQIETSSHSCMFYLFIYIYLYLFIFVYICLILFIYNLYLYFFIYSFFIYVFSSNFMNTNISVAWLHVPLKMRCCPRNLRIFWSETACIFSAFVLAPRWWLCPMGSVDVLHQVPGVEGKRFPS